MLNHPVIHFCLAHILKHIRRVRTGGRTSLSPIQSNSVQYSFWMENKMGHLGSNKFGVVWSLRTVLIFPKLSLKTWLFNLKCKLRLISLQLNFGAEFGA